MEQPAFQDLIPGNNCFGCGPSNAQGLRIKSYWDEHGAADCRYQPQPHHIAGPWQFINGGIIATLIDCHCICTSIADAYHREGRQIGSVPLIWYMTGSLSVTYHRPAPIATPVELRAEVAEVGPKKTLLTCSVTAAGEECATGEVVAVRLPYEHQET